MNFDDIKRKMNVENMDDNQIPSKIEDIKISNMPIQKVRKSMKSEVVGQLIFIIFFLVFPKLLEFGGREIYEVPLSLYYITIFISCLMGLGYVLKMTFFLHKTKHIEGNSKEVVLSFIHDLKLTLEVYKTAVISGSLLQVVSMFALFSGIKGMKVFNQETINLFNDLFFLNASNQTAILFILGYLVVAVFIYFITISWANKLYGGHIKNLEKILKEFDV